MYAYPDVIKFLRTIDDLFTSRSSVAEVGGGGGGAGSSLILGKKIRNNRREESQQGNKTPLATSEMHLGM